MDGTTERPSEWEWPTIAVAAAVYGGWAAVTLAYDQLPWWLVLVLGGYLVALHGSLQHEVLHGHPFRNAAANEALVYPSLGLWMPYRAYRDQHIAHHRTGSLTDPLDDPESNFVTREQWESMSAPMRALLGFRATVAGRLLVGPLLAAGSYWRDDARALARLAPHTVSHWTHHAIGCALVLTWVVWVCGIPLWEYVLLFAYPGLSLTLLRSFAEHRPHPDPGARTAIIEADPVMSLLYLNNNLHVIHHDEPGLAWYRIPSRWREVRDRAGDSPAYAYRFDGYGEILRRYLFTPRGPVLHPEQ